VTIRYRDATPDDAAMVHGLFARVFDDTFGHLYEPADYHAFMAEHSVDHWREQLSDPGYAVRLAESGEEAAGYAKIGPASLPVEARGHAVELRQLYVLKDWHGTGIAAALMDWTVEEARRREAKELYLTVFTENQRARRFYERYGFREVGPYKFMVGNQADEDLIMRLAL
jgi:GNAT superfamily N-acetyltransferase